MEVAALSGAWRESILRKTLVSSVVQKGTLVYLSHRTSVEDALATLNANGILSAPVVNTDTNMSWGSVDVLDLLCYVTWLPPTEMGNFPSLTVMKQRYNHNLSTVLTSLGTKEYFPILETVNLAQVVANYLSKQIHRVIVVNATNQITGILAQWDILNFIHRSIDTQEEFRLIATKALGQLFDLSRFRTVITVRESASLLDAFRLLLANRITGLAVVDGAGKMVGNLSASDFLGFDAKSLADTRVTTVGSFARRPVVACREDSTFADCLRLLVDNHVHRIYLVNDMDAMLPTAVISLTDIMALITSLLAL